MFKYNRIFHKVELYKMYLGGIYGRNQKRNDSLSKFSPYTVVDTKIENYKGEEYEIPRTVSLCRCGHSKNKPFCDGTHARGVEINNEREEEKTRGAKGYTGDKIIVYFDKYICKMLLNA